MSGFQLPAKSKHSFSWLNTLVKCEVNTHLPDGLAMNFKLHDATSQTKTTTTTTDTETTETETTTTETETIVIETTESIIPYSTPTLTSIQSEDLLSLSLIGESEIPAEQGPDDTLSLNHNVEEFVTPKCSIQKNHCLLLSKEHLRETIILSDVGGVMRPFVLTSGLDNGILHVFVDEDKSIAVTLHNHTTATFIMKEVNIDSLKVSLLL